MKTYPAPSKTIERASKNRSAAAAKATRHVTDFVIWSISSRADAKSPVTLEVSSSFISADHTHPVSQPLDDANKFGSEEASSQVKEG